jgi:integrase
MARSVNKLTSKQVTSLSEPGYYGDGNGLWLQISKYGTKSWVYRYSLDKKSHEMGLGSISGLSLAQARLVAQKHRDEVRDGIDPIQARKRSRLSNIQAAADLKTFDECSKSLIEAKQSGWKNTKHRQQWENTLSQYASPILGNLPVSDIDTALIVRVLEPIWDQKTETARRLRSRIEQVLDWATTRGYRSAPNPARWKGHLDTLLASPSSITKPEHHNALPYAEVGSLINKLRANAGISAKALEFTILTAARTNEVIHATWDEIDLEKALWTIPAQRMKAGKEHVVPLSEHVIALLRQLNEISQNGYIFPGSRAGQPISNMTMIKLLKRIQGKHHTVHGLRSTFRDWAGETTAYPREVIEHALAHQLKDKAEAAYQRGTLLAKRRRLMDDWAKFCSEIKTPTDNKIFPINRIGTTHA